MSDRTVHLIIALRWKSKAIEQKTTMTQSAKLKRSIFLHNTASVVVECTDIKQCVILNRTNNDDIDEIFMMKWEWCNPMGNTERKTKRDRIFHFLAVWPFQNCLSLDDHKWFTKWFIMIYCIIQIQTQFLSYLLVFSDLQALSFCIFWISFPLYCHFVGRKRATEAETQCNCYVLLCSPFNLFKLRERSLKYTMTKNKSKLNTYNQTT